MSEKLKYLNPKTQNFTVSDGGKPHFTQDEITGAMGMIKDRRSSLLLRVKYLSQMMFAQELYLGLYQEVALTRKTWADIRGHRPELVMDICKMALYEYCAPALCQTCNGLGTFINGALVINCQDCLGTGHRRSKKGLDSLGVKDNLRFWEQVYSQSLMVLDRWEGEGLADIRAALGENVD